MKPETTVNDPPLQPFPESEYQGLRILARIIARKRLQAFSENGRFNRDGLSSNALKTSSTTVLLRGKKKKQC